MSLTFLCAFTNTNIVERDRESRESEIERKKKRKKRKQTMKQSHAKKQKTPFQNSSAGERASQYGSSMM